MPGVAQVWLTQEELTALILAATKKGTVLSPRMEEAIVPKLNSARSYLGCPVRFTTPEQTAEGFKPAERQIDGQMDVEEVLTLAELELEEFEREQRQLRWEEEQREAEPVYGGF